MLKKLSYYLVQGLWSGNEVGKPFFLKFCNINSFETIGALAVRRVTQDVYVEHFYFWETNQCVFLRLSSHTRAPDDYKLTKIQQGLFVFEKLGQSTHELSFRFFANRQLQCIVRENIEKKWNASLATSLNS